MARVLKPGGRCLLWVSFVAGGAPYDPHADDLAMIDPYHLFHFDGGWFFELLGKHFDVVESLETTLGCRQCFCAVQEGARRRPAREGGSRHAPPSAAARRSGAGPVARSAARGGGRLVAGVPRPSRPAHRASCTSATSPTTPTTTPSCSTRPASIATSSATTITTSWAAPSGKTPTSRARWEITSIPSGDRSTWAAFSVPAGSCKDRFGRACAYLIAQREGHAFRADFFWQCLEQANTTRTYGSPFSASHLLAVGLTRLRQALTHAKWVLLPCLFMTGRGADGKTHFLPQRQSFLLLRLPGDYPVRTGLSLLVCWRPADVAVDGFPHRLPLDGAGVRPGSCSGRAGRSLGRPLPRRPGPKRILSGTTSTCAWRT